jgi:hypothetical protein
MKKLLMVCVVGALLVGAGPCVTLTPSQQAVARSLAIGLVRGGITYCEARKADREEYNSAKSLVRRATAEGGKVAWERLKAGASRAEAMEAGLTASRAYADAQGQDLAEAVALVSKGTPQRVSVGDVLEAVLREQVEAVAKQEFAAADAAQEAQK